MVKSKDVAKSRIGIARRPDRKWLLQHADSSLLSELGTVLGSQTIDTVNFHLRLLVGVDLSHAASEPKLVERGLRTLFGSGARVITEQVILVVFRSVNLIPEKDFSSLEEAIDELVLQASTSQWNSTKADHESHD